MPRRTVCAGERERITEKARADRRKELKAVETFGVAPSEGCECFVSFNRDLYAIGPEYMIGLKATPTDCSVGAVPDWAEACASATSEQLRQREVLYANAGAPMKHNANQGKQFVGTYPLTVDAQGQKVRSDAAVDWDFELSDTQRMGTRWSDPVGPDEKPDP